MQAVMNKIDKTLFTLRYLDDTESLTPSSFHSRQTTSNKFSSILEVAPCPISEASNSMEHELALLSRRLSRYGKQLKLGMKRPEDSHKEFHNLYDHFACLQSTEFLDVPSDTGLVALQSDLTLVATTFIPEGTMVTHIPYTFVRCSIPTIPCRTSLSLLLVSTLLRHSSMALDKSTVGWISEEMNCSSRLSNPFRSLNQ